jgi:hypothetical protein
VVDGAGLARDQAPEETLAKDPDRLARRQTLRRVEAMEWAASRRHLDLIAAIATTFTAELRRHGFRISGTRIASVSVCHGCHGFAVTAVRRRGQIDRAASIAHALASCDAEIAERRLRAWEAGKASP